MKCTIKQNQKVVAAFEPNSIEKAKREFWEFSVKHSDKGDLCMYDENGVLIATTNPFLDKYVSISREKWESLSNIDEFDSTFSVSDKQTVYFDMDGVLAKWGSGSTTPELPTQEEIFDISNHYFSKVQPSECTVKLFNMLIDRNYDVCVISNADKDTIPDKYFWLKEVFPDIKDEQIFFAPLGADKSFFVKGNADISVLIDDNSSCLNQWTEKGGNGIQFLNSFNTFDRSYPHISFFALEVRMQDFERECLEGVYVNNEEAMERRKHGLMLTKYRGLENAIEKINNALEKVPYVIKRDKEME